jgi:hypothetical protein
MREKRQYEWQVPEMESSPETRMGWVEDMLKESNNYQDSMSFFSKLSDSLRIFDAVVGDKTTKSTLVTNKLKMDIRKFVQALSDVREIGLYGSDVPSHKPYAEMVNKVAKNLYLEADFPLQISKALSYAAVMRRGYIWVKCTSDDYGWGERRIVFEPLGPLDVIPFQVPASNNVQDAYACTIYDYMPVAEAHARFPAYQEDLVPVANTKYETQIEARRADYSVRMRYTGTDTDSFGETNCEIRYTFVRDLRVNRTGYELPMGAPGTSWFYKVPYVGMPIFGGFHAGLATTRPALAEDCRLYPQLRLIITAKGMDKPMYDGPAYDWHGKIPLAQYDVDIYPWQRIGSSLIDIGGPVQQTIRKIERKLDTVVTVTLNPPLGYDRSSTGGTAIENIDIFRQDLRMGMDGQPSKVLESLLPPSIKVEGEHFTFLKYLKDELSSELGLDDIQSLAQLKQNVAGDAAEKALESIGPLAKGMAANLESANARIAHMIKFMVPQWYDTHRVMNIIGPDNITPQVFDFDPHSIVPSHMPDEMVFGGAPDTPSYYSQLDRAKYFAKNVRIISMPNTLLKITQMQEQLKWLQLYRGGAPIAFADVAKKLDIDNYGEVPGATLKERWFNETLEKMKLQALAALQAQKLGLAGGPDQGQGGGGGGGKKPHAGGRPPSGKKPPQIKQKGGPAGPRTTVTES